MKIVLLSANYPYGQGGDNNFIVNEIQALTETFDQVVVISTGEGELRKDIPKTVKVVKCPIISKHIFYMFKALFLSIDRQAYRAHKELKHFYPNLGFFTRFKQIVKYNYSYECLKKTLVKECINADIVYSYWLSSRAYAYARVKKNKGYNNVFISRSHGFDCYLSRNAYLPYRRFTSEQLNEIIFISKNGKESFERETYPMLDKNCRLSVHYLGVNKNVENQIYKSSNIINIVTCSSIIEVKRLDIIINALSFINDIKICWVHFGDGNMAKKIKDFAFEKLGDKHNIEYQFKGNVDNEDLIEYYRNNNVDLFVNTSDSEGIPVSIMEAYSFGIPAITRDVGGNREINCGNNKGYLLDKNATAKDFAKAITEYAYQSEEERVIRRNEVKKIFKEKFSAKAIKDYCESIRGIRSKEHAK
ncbi:MAG: glycosyltransferase [Christensenella sp.]|nr:glycosyltransferase [Christensenella sp.]